MFFKTGNRAVADWMAPPDTYTLLTEVRPDLIVFRLLARGLILWDDILPTEQWLESQLPKVLRFNLRTGPSNIDDDDYDFDHEALW